MNYKKGVSEKEKGIIVDLFYLGVSFTIIASAFGLSVLTVEQFIRDHNNARLMKEA